MLQMRMATGDPSAIHAEWISVSFFRASENGVGFIIKSKLQQKNISYNEHWSLKLYMVFYNIINNGDLSSVIFCPSYEHTSQIQNATQFVGRKKRINQQRKL